MSGNQIERTRYKTTTRKDIPPAERNDRWLTPDWIVDALGVFDLDPCGAPDHALARHTYLLENGDDGLIDPWFGRVWCNPPYGREMRQWIDRLVEHGTGTALIPVATGTKLWQDVIFPHNTSILYWRHRINFRHRDNKKDGMVSPQASALVTFGNFDADALEAATSLPGVYTRKVVTYN